MRLIDADRIEYEQNEDYKDDYTGKTYRYSYVRKENIDKMPTIKAEPVNGNWISVEDKLPDKSQRVLVFYKALGQENRIHNDVIASNWRTKKGDFIPCDGYKVTHWQPLPKPPKDGDENEAD